jgi:3D (Asp-Asp-Asp) domain-containing protein
VIHHTGIADQHIQKDLVEKNHEDRGYDESALGSHIAYHFLVGKDGTVVQNRSLIERTGHTRNNPINTQSIAIAVAGDFTSEAPTAPQVQALRKTIQKLDRIYKFERIIGHWHASPTGCPGKKLEDAIKDLLRNTAVTETYFISRYYTPVRGQPRYYRKTYEEDYKVNCGGDCRITANGLDLRTVKPMTVAACPPEMPFGKKIHIEDIGTVTCVDRGSAIQGKKIDVWGGFGMEALRRILNSKGGFMQVSFPSNL